MNWSWVGLCRCFAWVFHAWRCLMPVGRPSHRCGSRHHPLCLKKWRRIHLSQVTLLHISNLAKSFAFFSKLRTDMMIWPVCSWGSPFPCDSPLHCPSPFDDGQYCLGFQHRLVFVWLTWMYCFALNLTSNAPGIASPGVWTPFAVEATLKLSDVQPPVDLQPDYMQVRVAKFQRAFQRAASTS